MDELPIIKELSVKMKMKRNSLIEAARNLFIEKGIHNTSIDAIVQRANVAKGTFYLYFKDKDALLSEIVYGISRTQLLKAFNETKKLKTCDFTEKFIFMIDIIIDYFLENQHELKLVRKNFSWPLMKERLTTANEDIELSDALHSLVKNKHMENYSDEEAKNIIFATIEMCGSLCFSCIINKQPTDMETMKPTLYMMIRKILQ